MQILIKNAHFLKTNVFTRVHKFHLWSIFFMKLVLLDSVHTELSIHAKSSIFMKYPNIAGHKINVSPILLASFCSIVVSITYSITNGAQFLRVLNNTLIIILVLRMPATGRWILSFVLWMLSIIGAHNNYYACACVKLNLAKSQNLAKIPGSAIQYGGDNLA